MQYKPLPSDSAPSGAIIIDHLATKPDGRTLNWYHEEDGNISKSFLTTYLMSTEQAYCPDITKTAGIFCG